MIEWLDGLPRTPGVVEIRPKNERQSPRLGRVVTGVPCECCGVVEVDLVPCGEPGHDLVRAPLRPSAFEHRVVPAPEKWPT